ncbi:MAG: bifunctional demethylmenaquinone methyltransferase/2-methoxy-6-polyprenyl-1,4-benzoquinol methylase UbiE [Vicinamibacterales bacterium]
MSTDRARPTPDGVPLDKAPSRIAGMFDAIAARYDLLNTVLSAGLDRHWRLRAIASLRLSGRERLLDVCTGTADIALGAARAEPGAARVVGVDFAGAMLAHGREKVDAAGLAPRVQLIRGDATTLPVADQSVDALTIAFGIRNVQAPDAACREIRRVLKPGGRVAILEFGLPGLPGLRHLYGWYFRSVLPRVGRLVSRHGGAYAYLPASVGAFPYGQEFVDMLTAAGLTAATAKPLTLGVVYLYNARRPDRDP